jgi:hypothetical protein
VSQEPGPVDPVDPVDESHAAVNRGARVCPSCGRDCASDARFCSQCGTALNVDDDAPGYAGWSSSRSASGAVAADDATVVPAADVTGLIAPVGTAAEPIDVPVVDEATSADLPSGAGMLLVRRGVFEGTSFVLDGPVGTVVSVGRTPDSTLFLDDVTVSRRHAEFRRGEQGWTVHDVGSLNGTYVERRRTDEDEHLAGGEEIQIGKYRFVFLAAALDRPVADKGTPTSMQGQTGEGAQ